MEKETDANAFRCKISSDVFLLTNLQINRRVETMTGNLGAGLKMNIYFKMMLEHQILIICCFIGFVLNVDL